MSDEFFKPEDFREHTNWHHAALAETANRIIRERSRVVYGGVQDDGSYWGNSKAARDTHRALLINIEPIAKPDSAKELLRELFDKTNRKPMFPIWDDAQDKDRWLERARKLLEGK